ncbi:MAG: hypothetical protein AAB654_23725 [Acidobacteriota bacterium]
MRDDVRDAIDSACSSTTDGKRPASFEFVKRRLLAIVRDLPEDMTVRELREDLED